MLGPGIIYDAIRLNSANMAGDNRGHEAIIDLRKPFER
jgi:hypothetical protein